MFKYLLIITLLLTSCTATNVAPPADVLANANYGEYPSKEQITTEIRSYLITKDYFDPMSAQVERCENLGKHYEENFNYDSNQVVWNFGYKIQCYINVKNRLGGYTGFVRNAYFYSDGKIVSDYVNTFGRALFGNKL